MDLIQLQRATWDIAEDKGLHDALDTPGHREQALAHLAWVFQGLTDIAQRFKRRGIPDSEQAWRDFFAMRSEVITRLTRWEHDVICGFRPLPCANIAALMRLTLIHTEVSEAAGHVIGLCAEPDAGILDLVGDELADIVIRVCDCAETLGVDIDAKVMATLAKNRARPYKYGTPDEERPNHDSAL